jgi:hypothetical protein
MNYCLENLPWIEDPNYKNNPYYLTLSSDYQSKIDNYVNNGFLILENTNIINNIDFKSLEKSIRLKYDWKTNRVQDAHLFCEQSKQIACNKIILETLKIIYNRTPVPFQTLNFITGTQQATHSDFIHFNTIPYHYMCGVWVALEDVSLKQGPLHYYVGSHKHEAMEYEKLIIDTNGDRYLDTSYFSKSYHEYENKIDKIAKQFLRKELEIKKGDCLIWASNLLHGGSKIENHTLTRWSQVTHYLFDNVIPITPMLSNPSKNEWMIRNPNNILTGKPMNRNYNGIKIDLPKDPGKHILNIKV